MWWCIRWGVLGCRVISALGPGRFSLSLLGLQKTWFCGIGLEADGWGMARTDKCQGMQDKVDSVERILGKK